MSASGREAVPCPACSRNVGVTKRGVLYRHNVPVVGRACWGSAETLAVLQKIRAATDKQTAAVVAEIDAARINAQPGGRYGRPRERTLADAIKAQP